MAEPSTQRKGSTVKERQNYFEQQRQRIAAVEKRKELFPALNAFCRSNNRGWLTSRPGDPFRIECEPHSELPDLLIDRGFDLQPCGTGTRIENGKFIPICIYVLHVPSPR